VVFNATDLSCEEVFSVFREDSQFKPYLRGFRYTKDMGNLAREQLLAKVICGLHLLITFPVQPIRPIDHITAEMWKDYRTFKAPGLLHDWRRKWAA
jgi:hypothetical protein